ncbi:MAG: hypothetical protein JNK12_18085 [Acidimicrobiales bacterium]|nr:hypothetical protein [Acidimicrobiales bacterium]
MSATRTFERLAERGTPRGADAVLRAARVGSNAEVHAGRRWPVRVVLVGVAAVFVLVVAVALRGGNEDSGPVDTGPGTGYLFGEPTDTTLIINTGFGSLVALDLDTGMARQYDDIAVRPREIFLQSIDQIGDEVVYQGDDGPIAMPLDLEGAPRLVAPSYYYLASGNPDRLWLVQQDNTVSEVTVDGVTTVPSTQVPQASSSGTVSPNVGVAEGLALPGPFADGPGPQYWSPVSGDLVDLPDAETMAARGSTLVTGWPSSIAVVPDGGSVDIDPDLFAWAVAVSPDEQTVAVWSRSEEDSEWALVLVDAHTGHWRSIPGGPGFDATGLAWTDDGSWVFALGDGAVYGYRMGTPSGLVVHTQSIIGGGPLAVERSDGPQLAAADPIPCPERTESVPSPDETIVQAAPDGGLPMPTVDVEVPITSATPCLIRRGG